MRGRHVVLGVTGGIAAYKAALLARRLVVAGVELDVILSRGAREFIGSATFEGITGRPVRSEVWEDIADATHVELGRRADIIAVYPTTAHTLAKLATGLADDLLTTAVLAYQGQLLLAPAMHTEMWEHPATVANVERLRARGAEFVGPASGPLMGGDAGQGRLVEPEEMFVRIAAALGVDAPTEAAGDDDGGSRTVQHPGDLAGRRVLVTAGGTQEPIDAVRYIGNRSSGRMGFALAEAARDRGAEVILITGPTSLATPFGLTRIDIATARDLEAAVAAHSGSCDVVLMAAAVADFRPEASLAGKLSRAAGAPDIRLVPNPDVLAGLVADRGSAARPVLVGFAAQHGDLEATAEAKLAAKGVDVLVANDVSIEGIGFDQEHNEVLVLHRGGRRTRLDRAPKRRIAEAILDEVAPLLV